MIFGNILHTFRVLWILLSFIQRISKDISQKISFEVLIILGSHLCRWVFSSWLFAQRPGSLWSELKNVGCGMVLEPRLKPYIFLLCSSTFAKLWFCFSVTCKICLSLCDSSGRQGRSKLGFWSLVVLMSISVELCTDFQSCVNKRGRVPDQHLICTLQKL